MDIYFASRVIFLQTKVFQPREFFLPEFFLRIVEKSRKGSAKIAKIGTVGKIGATRYYYRPLVKVQLIVNRRVLDYSPHAVLTFFD